jgi:hypothetical protein
MSVLQYPARKRSIALLACAVLALIVLGTATRASAESTVLSNRQTNVFLYYGTSSTAEGYVSITQIYKNGTFTNTSSKGYGSLNVSAGNVYLKLPKSETKVQIVTNYTLANGEQISFAWSGKGGLPIRRSYLSSEATLVSVDVGAHSPKLPNQPKEPEYEGMH